MLIQLRDYQRRGITALEESFSTHHKRPCFVMATGGGKTFTASFLAQQSALNGKRTLILVHRNELVSQWSDSLTSLGMIHGVIAPTQKPNYAFNIQVASVQTLVRRIKLREFNLNPDLIIVDECHHATAGTWKTILDFFSNAHVLGVTATPCRQDNKYLSDFFDDLIIGATPKELIASGSLSSYKVYGSERILDLSGIKTKSGDFDNTALTDYLASTGITGDAISSYRKYAEYTPALVYCASIKHAEATCTAFNEAGYLSAIVHGKQDYYTRKRLIRDLGEGRLHALVSVDVISEGTDIPIATTAIFLRPTYSLSLAHQQFGRVLRPHKDKSHAIILDHVGNVVRHQPPDADINWEKHFYRPLKTKEPKKLKEKTKDPVRLCAMCFHVYEAKLSACPVCDHAEPPKSREVSQDDGELVLIEGETLKRALQQAHHLKDFHRVAQIAGKSSGWAYIQHQNRELVLSYEHLANGVAS
jgi:DNA repair protein RadD